MGYSTRLLYLAPLVYNGEFLEWVTVLSFPLTKSAEDPHANAHLPWQRFEWVTQFSLRSARTSGHEANNLDLTGARRGYDNISLVTG